MNRRTLLSIVLLSLFPLHPSRAADDERALDAATRLGDPIRIENLTLVPILAVSPVADDREYLTLDEAFDQKLVKVREMDNESVNSLSLENLSDRPLFVLSGEVIIGGKQDRVIGKEQLIQPRTAAIIEVFCVEHGRWSEEGGPNGKTRSFRTARTLAHTKLRLSAGYDTQSDVWNEVSAKNAKRGTGNATDTYRAVTRDKKVDKAIAPYKAAVDKAWAGVDRDRVIGVVVALGGEIVAVESFGSPKLFDKLRGKLFASYFVEAIDHPRGRAKLATISATTVKAFLAAGADAEAREVVRSEKSRTVQKKAAGTAETEVIDADAPAAAPRLYKGKHRH